MTNWHYLIQIFKQEVSEGIQPTDLADAAWLAAQWGNFAADSAQTDSGKKPSLQPSVPISTADEIENVKPPESPIETPEELAPPSDNILDEASTHDDHLDVQLPNKARKNQPRIICPAPPALKEPDKLAKALRGFHQRIPSRFRMMIDERATVDSIIEKNSWEPVLHYELERRFEVALVVEKSVAMGFWHNTVTELKSMLVRKGIFRDVRVWSLLKQQDTGEFAILPNLTSQAKGRKPKTLTEPNGRKLILLISDCVSEAWYDGGIVQLINQWAMPVALLQMLPEKLWQRTGLSTATPIRLLPKSSNLQTLSFKAAVSWMVDAEQLQEGLFLPIAILEPSPLKQLAQLVTGTNSRSAPGFYLPNKPSPTTKYQESKTLTPKERLEQFWRSASPNARQLAKLLAAAPCIRLPIIRLIREAMLKEATHIHEAEFLLSGLLEVIHNSNSSMVPDKVDYDFIPEVRDELLDAQSVTDSRKVLEKVSQYVEEHLGEASGFAAILANPSDDIDSTEIGELSESFATVATSVLKRLGGRFKKLVEKVGLRKWQKDKESNKSTTEQKSGSQTVEPRVIGNSVTVSTIVNSVIVEKHECDPTRLLPNQPNDMLTFDSAKEIEEHFELLKTKRVLLVECFDEKILLAATYKLVNKAEDYYEKRYLAVSSEQTNLHLGIFVNEKIKIGSGEKLIVVISLKSQRFLDSMFVEKSLYAQSIKDQLEKNDIMLVCFANSGFLQENVAKKKCSNFHFPKWNIPFLPYLLKTHFIKDEAKSVEEQILRQRNYGLWDENNSDLEFYGLVYGYLRSGVEQLRKEVEKREQYEEGQSVQKFLKEIQDVRPKELIQDDDLIKNTVLYVAAFFPGLSRRDFDFIVSLLLNGEKTTIEIESTRKTKKGKIKTVRTTKKRNCLKIWEKSQDKILIECHLQVIRSETGSQIIDFSLPYLRGELKKYLEQKSLYLKHFERLKESGLLFNFNISRNIIDNMINLSVEMAVSNPSYYGGNWLMDIFIGIKHLAINVEEADNEPEALIQSLIQSFLDEERRQKIRPIIIRLSELIREMLNYPQLQEMIKSSFLNLMRRQRFDAALVIVLGIVKQLRFASQFDGLYWIRQLLERGDPDAKNEAYNTLLEQTKLSGSQSDELLGRLQTWLPERDLEYEKYSYSNKYAIKFIMDYARNTVSHFKEVHYGAWPSKYPLFANIEDSQDFKQIDILISWVFHPGMQDTLSVLENDFLKNNNMSVNILLADLIEMWFKILYGLDTKKVHPKSLLAALNRLLQQIVLNTDRSQQRDLMRRWWARQSFFREEINKVSVAQRAQRKQLSNERQVILELHKKFNALTQ